MSVAKLAARGLIGGLFIGHGTQKLKGWFGGPGMAGTEGMMASLGMHPARPNALAAGLTETGGGTLLALGLATPLASASLIGVMTTAIRKVHLPNGPWAANGGWEYNAVLIAALTVLAEQGPGPVSLDWLLGTERSGVAWGLGALGLGVAASMATVEMAHRSAPAAESSGPPPHDIAGDPVTADWPDSTDPYTLDLLTGSNHISMPMQPVWARHPLALRRLRAVGLVAGLVELLAT